MRPIQFSTSAQLAADDDALCLSQTPLAAGALTLNGALVSSGVGYIAPAAFITITCAGNDAGRTFTAVGKTPEGWDVTFTQAGADVGATTSTVALSQLTSISVDAATAGAIEVGIAQAGYGPWRPLDIYTPNPQTAISTDVTGTVNYTWQYTNDDPFDPSIPHIAVDHPVAALVGAATDQTGQATIIMRAVRLKINSGSGTTRNTITQQSTQ